MSTGGSGGTERVRCGRTGEWTIVTVVVVVRAGSITVVVVVVEATTSELELIKKGEAQKMAYARRRRLLRCVFRYRRARCRRQL